VDVVGLRIRGRAAIQRALAAREIEVHRTRRGVRRTLPSVLEHYKQLGLAPATVFDVGVASGTPELYDAFRRARLILVEPIEEWRAQLERLGRAGRTDVVIAAAGARAGNVEIAVHRVPELSSTLGGRQGDAATPTPRSVPVVRLDDLKLELGLTGPFVVKVDVEGGELDVLGGALDVLTDTDLVLLEVSLFQFLDNAPQFHDVVLWMHEHGFVVGDIYNGHNRPLDGALALLDVAFVQEHGRFRRHRAYATPAQADALYRSWGR
jgi:FkbM family methyltransferase